MNHSAYIEFLNVTKRYGNGKVQVHALSGVTFSMEKGEFCVLLGASGAGKTTLLNVLGGMDSVTSGEILFDGKQISGLKKAASLSGKSISAEYVPL